MAKRNAALDALASVATPPAAETTPPPTVGQGAAPKVVEPKTAKVVALQPAQDEKADVARVMLYLHPKVAKKVKEIALHEDCKAHDIYLKALDSYLKTKGFGGLADIAAR
jgi:hypothetical protein